MVTKSTANTKAKKESAQRKEAYASRQTKPCVWCGAPLNTMEKFFGHTKAVCRTIQKNKEGNPKDPIYH